MMRMCTYGEQRRITSRSIFRGRLFPPVEPSPFSGLWIETGPDKCRQLARICVEQIIFPPLWCNHQNTSDSGREMLGMASVRGLARFLIRLERPAQILELGRMLPTCRVRSDWLMATSTLAPTNYECAESPKVIRASMLRTKRLVLVQANPITATP